MAISLSDLGVVEDIIPLVKGPNGEMVAVVITCSSIKFSQGVTLQTVLTDLCDRVTALENNLTWNGPAAAQNNNSE